ncbi:acyltransferase [Daejeonia sp. YH14]|uniref:acyltransferase n=1 Tax=Daejeonia sp. YH14 TaxID=3439042 RepID=UPI003F49552D
MRKIYHKVKAKIRLYIQINWIKTILLNFRFFPLKDALKFPIIIFGKCAFGNMDGKIVLDGQPDFGRIGIGQRYQMFKKEKGVAELQISGELILQGRAQFGLDFKLYIGKNAICTVGDMTSIGNDSTLICTKKITFGKFCRMGSETYISDSNFHNMKNTQSGEIFPKSFEITIGNYNFIGTRVTILGKTQTPDYATIASCSLANKDYTAFGEKILLGGIPSRLIKNNVARDWEGEKVALENYLKL